MKGALRSSKAKDVTLIRTSPLADSASSLPALAEEGAGGSWSISVMRSSRLDVGPRSRTGASDCSDRPSTGSIASISVGTGVGRCSHASTRPAPLAMPACSRRSSQSCRRAVASGRIWSRNCGGAWQERQSPSCDKHRERHRRIRRGPPLGGLLDGFSRRCRSGRRFLARRCRRRLGAACLRGVLLRP